MKKILRYSLIAGIIAFQACQQSTTPEEKMQVAIASFEAGDTEKSAETLNEILSQEPGNIEAITYKSRLLFKKGEKQQAIDLLTKAIEENPEHTATYGYRGAMYNVMGNLKMAVKDLDVVLEEEPENKTLRMIRASSKINLKKYEEALKDYDHLLEETPDDYDLLVKRGFAYRKLDRIEEAKADLNRAIALNPDDLRAKAELAYVSIQTQEFEEAIAAYSALVKEIPTEENYLDQKVNAYNNLSFAYFHAMMPEKALASVNISLAIKEMNPSAYKNRALIYFQLGKKAEACEDLEMAEALNYTELYGDEVEKLIEMYCAESHDETHEEAVEQTEKSDE